jgi:hypothetical protein
LRKPRAIIEIPQELANQIDTVAGAGNRSRFVAELLDHELRRRRQLEVLRAPLSVWKDSVWNDADHPDLAAVGEEEWVRRQREEGESRVGLLFPDSHNE